MSDLRILDEELDLFMDEQDRLENPCSYPDYPNTDEPDGTLQRMIWEGEETAEYEDYLIDIEWLRGGC